MSGFFFCGMIEEPVEKASWRVTKENSFVFQMMTSSAIRERLTPIIAVMNANSATKSREAVPSMELATEPCSKPRSAATACGSSPSEDPASAPEPYGRDGGALVPLAQPLGVPGEGLHMGEHVVGEEDGLGVLEVGPAGHRDVRVGLGEADQRALEVGDQAADGAGVVAQVHPEERGDLVVPGPPGPELAAEVGAEALQQSALQGGVDVLVGDGAGEGAVGDVGFELVEPGEHPGQFVLGEQARLVEDAGVGAGAGDVVRREPPVEVDGGGQLGQCLGRSVGETRAPEPDVTVVAAHCVLLRRQRRVAKVRICDRLPAA